VRNASFGKAIVVLGLLLSTELVSGDLQKGLLGHWTFDGTKPNVAADASRNGRDGRILGAVRTGPGPEKALRFGGRGAVDFGSPEDGCFDFGTDGDVCLSVWIHVSAPPADQYGLVGKGDGGRNPKLLLKILDTGKLLFRIAAGRLVVDANGKTNVADGKWRHVVAVAQRRR